MGAAAKYYSTTHVHPFSWDDVACAIFQRYPNPMSSHVLSVDTLHCEAAGPILHSRRFLTKTNKLPKWAEKLLPGNLKRLVPLVEDCRIDRELRTIVTYTRNIGLGSFMTAVERVCYRSNPENPAETLAIKEVWVESSLYGIRSAVKNFGIERFKKNCIRATDGFNHVLLHFQERQQLLTEANRRRWHEIRARGESAMLNAAQRASRVSASD